MGKLSKGLWKAALLTSATAAAAVASSGVANAQQATAPAPDETIIVTGSFIRGTPETTALPVQVVTANDLLNRGAPSTLDLIKSLPSSNGVLGDTNQFDARSQGSEGSGSINLRGLGPQRTLVLLNGHRVVANPFALVAAGAPDTNTIPAAAVGRVEVLKEGAAATYGSDAVGGVVNFITNSHFSGLQIGGDYRAIDGSDGDGDLNAMVGIQGRQAHWVLSVAGQHRSELPTLARDWATQPYLTNPQGGWSAAGSPNAFIPLGATTTRFRDPDCATLGGTPGLTGAPPSVTPVCYWQYSKFDNLVEDEDRYQIFSELNIDLSDTTKFHLDGLIAQTISGYNTSPSYALLQTPTALDGAVAGQFFVPSTNPGLVAFVAAHPGGITTADGVISATGAPTAIPIAAVGAGDLYVAGRPFALGGDPLFNHKAVEATRKYNAFRLSGGLSGEFGNGVTWDANVTYSEEEAYRDGRDTIVNRFQRALRGLGGPTCPTSGGTPGAGGCMWFNPFASGIPGNGITGVANPGFNGSLGANENAALINWFFPNMFTRDTTTLTVSDLVFTGSSGVHLAGGDVSWAAGVQNREETYKRELSPFSNIDLNPCIDSIDFNVTSCAVHTGALGFLGSSSESHLHRSVNAAFGELHIPVTDDFEVQLAARYEDYGGQTGSTTNPKISARWQLTHDLALRASAGSTFRAPSLTQVTNGVVTALQNVAGTFRAVDIFGNPSLTPEKAKNYDIGVIFDTRRFFATIDAWRFDFDNPIVTDPLAGMVNTLFPNGSALPNRCGDPTLAALQARFTFNGACGTGTITRVRTNNVNGPAVQNSGIDAEVRYEFDGGIAGGAFTVGATGTYVLEYKVDASFVEGVKVAAPFDAAGHLNYQTQFYPIPKYRWNAYLQWSNPNQNLRFGVNYINGYKDQRTDPFVASLATNSTVISAGKRIDSFITYDLNYRWDLSPDSTFLLGVQNLTDQDPPFARLDLNYDPFTADSLGRTFRIGFRQHFR